MLTNQKWDTKWNNLMRNAYYVSVLWGCILASHPAAPGLIPSPAEIFSALEGFVLCALQGVSQMQLVAKAWAKYYKNVSLLLSLESI